MSLSRFGGGGGVQSFLMAGGNISTAAGTIQVLSQWVQFSGGESDSAWTQTISAGQNPFVKDMTFRNLNIRIAFNTLTADDFTFGVQTALALTDLFVTIPFGVTGNFTNIVDSGTCAANADCGYKIDSLTQAGVGNWGRLGFMVECSI